MTILIVLAIVAGLIGLGVAASYVHGYSRATYGYSPFKVSILGLMVLTVVLVVIGMPPGEMTTGEYLDRLVTFQWTGMSNSAVALLAATISVVGSFIFIMKKTNVWIALFSLTLMFLLSVAAWIVVVLAQMAKQKKNE